jgi:hypothetical protein
VSDGGQEELLQAAQRVLQGGRRHDVAAARWFAPLRPLSLARISSLGKRRKLILVS